MARRKKKNKKISRNSKHYLYGIILLSFILEIFVITNNIGVFGESIKNFFFKIFGMGSYLFFPLILIQSIMILLDRYKNQIRKNFIWINILFLLGLLLVDFYQNSGELLKTRIYQSMRLAEIYRGSGIIGATLCFGVRKLFGNVGVYLLSILLIFFSSINFLDISVKEVAMELKAMFITCFQYLRRKYDHYKTQRMKTKKEKILEEKIKKDHEPLKKVDDRKKKNNKNASTNQEPEFKDYTETKTEQLAMEEFRQDSPGCNYIYPPIELMKNPEKPHGEDRRQVMAKAEKIEETLNNFGIESKVVRINRGPQVTCYELQPKPGIKVARIVNLADDLSLSLATSEIRIEAPIPGKAAVGIEVPNDQKDLVTLKEIINTEEFKKIKSKMPIALGKSISGRPIVSSIDKMPHLLIAGATGSGKSVCINTIIMSILYKSSPEDVKMILIDPKVVELSIYNEIPHLAIPVVTDPKKASHALHWAVSEMERRYKIFSENFVRDITSYNEKAEEQGEETSEEKKQFEKLPFIIIIIDELSDLMMVASQEVEDAICRLAQMARACGIHLIVATQRPTVDVITGTIKANIPSRISFAVSSQIDSRTILDSSGAEKLLGKGDMLFYPSNIPKPLRVQGAFIPDREVENIVRYIREKNGSDYNKEIIEDIENAQQARESISSDDELFEKAVATILAEDQASISLLQRKLKIGYARAGRLIDEMEEQGIVGGHEGSKPRKILVSRDFLEGDD
ncbi:MAG: DNA translocase FtsK 4TM domain-containing protein [Tissierellia bacterium]|nr:DNA translocase FtsK 4TM domain-containing protein [Tissierellia bacterium]